MNIYQPLLERDTTLDLQATTFLTSMVHLSFHFQTQIMKATYFHKTKLLLTSITHHKHHKTTFNSV